MTHEQLAAIADCIAEMRDMVEQASVMSKAGYCQQHVKMETLKRARAALAELDGNE